MDDNLYKMFKDAWGASQGSDANIFGVEIGIVTNVQDPEKQGRVKVCFPRLPGKPESSWARVTQPAAGGGRGFYWLPEVNDEVMVAFERGQSKSPFVLGGLWNGKDKPMKDAYTDDNTTRMIQTKSGHQIIFSDKDGEEKIVIGDKSGNRTITFDVKAKKFLIEAKEGDIVIDSKKKLVFECEDLEIKATKTGKIDIGSSFDLKVGQKAQFKAGPAMNLKASKVHLNPSSISVAALVGAAAAAAAAAAKAAAAAAEAKKDDPAAAGGAGPAGAGGGTVPSHDAAGPGGAGAAAGGAGAEGGGDAAGGKGAAAGAGGAGAAGAGAGPGGAGAAAGAGGKPAAGGAGDPAAAGGAGAAGAGGAAAGGKDEKPVAPAEKNDIVVKVADAKGNPVKNLPFELTLPDGTVRKGITGWQGQVEVRGLPKAGDYKLVFPDLEKGGGAAGAGGAAGGGAAGGGAAGGGAGPATEPGDTPKPKDPAAAGDQLPADMLGAAAFAGVVPGPLTADEEKFILSLAKRTSSPDEHLKLMRLVFKAYRTRGVAAPAAAGMSSQFVIESDWGRAVTGKFNYFGIKGKNPGTLCTTSEHNLSAAAIEQLTAEGRYLGDETRADGTVVSKIKDWFKDYDSLDQALQRKVDLLHNGKTYIKHQVLESPTPEEFCKRIKDAGYATAVEYTPVLIARLKSIDQYAAEKKGKAVQVIQETANADIEPARFKGGSFA